MQTTAQNSKNTQLSKSALDVTITSARGQTDIANIKLLLLERKTQTEIATELGLDRSTVNRKIQQWIVTPDFEIWLKTLWLEQCSKVGDTAALNAVTQIFSRMITRREELQVKAEVQVHVTHTAELLRRYEVLIRGEENVVDAEFEIVKGNGVENENEPESKQ